MFARILTVAGVLFCVACGDGTQAQKDPAPAPTPTAQPLAPASVSPPPVQKQQEVAAEPEVPVAELELQQARIQCLQGDKTACVKVDPPVAIPETKPAEASPALPVYRQEFYRCEKTATYENGEVGFLNDFIVVYKDNVYSELNYNLYYFNSGSIEGVPLDTRPLQLDSVQSRRELLADSVINTTLGLALVYDTKLDVRLPTKAIQARIEFDVKTHTLSSAYTVEDIRGAHVVLSTYKDSMQCVHTPGAVNF